MGANDFDLLDTEDPYAEIRKLIKEQHQLYTEKKKTFKVNQNEPSFFEKSEKVYQKIFSESEEFKYNFKDI